jgi:hypothetical protein
MPTVSLRAIAASSAGGRDAVGGAATRSRVSGWVLARLVLLLVAQILMIVTLLIDHPAVTVATTPTTAAVTQVAFTRPLAPSRVAVPASGSGSMTCAGRSTDRDRADHGAAYGSATGFNLNVVIGHGRQSGAGAGPLVVTCGEQGRLMILACAPLTGDSGRAPAAWDRPLTGGLDRAGWAPAGWDQPGWRGMWRRDWRSQGFSDEQLDLLNQLDPDQLRALLGQRYPVRYPGGGDRGGSVAGLSFGGMKISVGAPTSLNQPPWGASTTGPYLDPDADPYARPYASNWGNSWSSSYSPGYGGGYGTGYGASGLERPGYADSPDSPVLISTHHRHSDPDNDDDPDEERKHDNARGGWGTGEGAQRVAVCRSIEQR